MTAWQDFLHDARDLLGDGSQELDEGAIQLLLVFEEALRHLLDAGDQVANHCNYVDVAARQLRYTLDQSDRLQLEALAVAYGTTCGEQLTHCLNCQEELPLRDLETGSHDRCSNVSGGCEIAIGSCGQDGGDLIPRHAIQASWNAHLRLNTGSIEFSLPELESRNLRGMLSCEISTEEKLYRLFAIGNLGTPDIVVEALHFAGQDCTMFQSHALPTAENDVIVRALISYFLSHFPENSGALTSCSYRENPRSDTGLSADPAETWERLSGEGFAWRVTERRLLIEGFLGTLVGHDSRVLNLCCGRRAYISREAVSEQVGIDIVEATLRQNRDINREKSSLLNLDNPEVEFPYAPGEFNRAVMVSGIRYLKNPGHVFGQTVRVLAPGSLVAVGFDNSHIGQEHDSPMWRELTSTSEERAKSYDIIPLPRYRDDICRPQIQAVESWFQEAGIEPIRAVCLTSQDFPKPYIFVIGKCAR